MKCFHNPTMVTQWPLTSVLFVYLQLLLDSIATFTCYELFDYNTFVFYTVISSIVSLDRPVLRDKVTHEN